MLKQIIIILAFSSSFIMSQEAKWVEATGSCIAANISPEEAMKRARDDARSNAVESVTGMTINQSEFLKQSEIISGDNARNFEDVFLKLNLSTLSGKIIEEEAPEYTPSFEGNFPKYTVKIRAKVAVENGTADPDFYAKIILPGDVFYDKGNLKKNDNLNFRLWASKDCYVYLFNIMSNDSVQLILPNEYIKDNSFIIGQKEQQFERSMKLLGMKFPVVLPEGKEKGVEGLFLVALKEKKDFTSTNFSNDASGIIPTYKAALTDIMKWLIRIPADKRTETFSGFEIRRK